MSLINLFINKFKGSQISRAVADGKTVVIPIDCITDEAFDIPAEITNHPVENNADISDHAILRPKTLTLEGIISESPLNLAQVLQGAVQGAAGALGQASLGTAGSVFTNVAGGFAGRSVAGLLTETNQNSGTRVGDAINELIAARDSRAPIIIQTGLRIYPGNDSVYMIKNISIKRNKSTGQSIMVSMAFQEVIKVKSKTIKIAYPKTPQATQNQKQGLKKAVPTPDEESKNSSLLLKLGQFGGILK